MITSHLKKNRPQQKDMCGKNPKSETIQSTLRQNIFQTKLVKRMKTLSGRLSNANTLKYAHTDVPLPSKSRPKNSNCIKNSALLFRTSVQIVAMANDLPVGIPSGFGIEYVSVRGIATIPMEKNLAKMILKRPILPKNQRFSTVNRVISRRLASYKHVIDSCVWAIFSVHI